MSIPFQDYICTFPDFDESDWMEIEAPDPQEAAIRATGRWEQGIGDHRVLNGQDTLHIRVQMGTQVTFWEVGAERGRYQAKQMSETYRSGGKREYVTGRQLRHWLDCLTAEELDRPVMLNIFPGGNPTFVVVDCCEVALSGGGTPKVVLIEQETGQEWVPRRDE